MISLGFIAGVPAENRGRVVAARIECLRVSWACSSVNSSCADHRRGLQVKAHKNLFFFFLKK